MAGGESYDGITVPEGDPGALEASAGRLVASAGLLQSFSGQLNGLLGALSWFGPASAQHAQLTGAQSLMAGTGASALFHQAGVISDYADVLRAAQRQARHAIERARDADRRIRQAKADIRQAQLDQASAEARIIAAQAAQSRVFEGAVDLLTGAGAAAAHLAEREEADARRDLAAAEGRERDARRRLAHAEDDRREALRDGRDAEEAVALSRTGLIAAAQGAGLLPTQPGGPASASFAAAAGIVLPQPPKPEEDHRNWFERRLDDVGHAASWTWDQAKQVPGGVWEGTKGIYEGGRFLMQLNPLDANNLMHPGDLLHHYEQLGAAGKFAWEHPGEFGKQIINYDDLAHGRYGEWAGNLVPDAILAVTTGGAGTAATRATRIARSTSRLAEAERAFTRATEIQSKMPTMEYRVDKTIAAHAGDQGRVSISGEQFDRQAKMLERTGQDPSVLDRTSSAQVNQGVFDRLGLQMRASGLDKANAQPKGWYYGTHAELRLLLHDSKLPVGVTRFPCPESCDPTIQALAHKMHQDIVVQSSPDGATLYKADGHVVPHARPQDFTGVNSRWPGVLWGAGGATAGATAGP